MRPRPVALLTSALLIMPCALRAQAAAPPAARPKPAQLPADSLERARRFAVWVMTARSDSLIANMDSVVRGQMGTATQIEGTAADIAARMGTEERVIAERWVTRLGKRQYWRTSKFDHSDEPVMLRIVMLASGQFAGLGLNPASAAPPIDP
jgi:hypothetical protein